MRKHEFTFDSATGVGPIYGCAYLPDEGEAEKILVIHHGMAEHQQRYEPFIQFLCSHRIGVWMHDMANHGRSNQNEKMTGWFGERDGWKGLIEDFRTVVLRAKEANPGRQLYVMGHSMGSFVCRMYTAMYPEDHPAGAIFMGTGGLNPAGFAGKAVASMIGCFRGKQHKSTLMNRLAFGTYNRTFENRTPYDWLTRDEKIVDEYIRDSMCGFLFTTQGMNDLVDLNIESNLKRWYDSVPKDLPILLTSGKEDPVGGYGKGVREVESRLKETGHTRVTLKLYAESRHEILNEVNRDDVMADILAWLQENTEG